jgi:hypothetical protein
VAGDARRATGGAVGRVVVGASEEQGGREEQAGGREIAEVRF